jgi:integrase
MRNKVTIRAVERLAKDETLWDTETRGFGVRRQKDRRVYVLKTSVKGRQRFYTIGEHGAPWTVETARAKAKSLLGCTANGEEPAHRAPLAERLDEAIELFYNEHKTQVAKSTADAYRRQIDKYIKPAMGTIRIPAVAVDDVARLHGAMRATPYQANRTFMLLSTFFDWCESPRRRYRHKNTNPCDLNEIELYPEYARHRDLTPEELGRVGAAMAALESKKPFAIAALRLLIFTGCRRTEVLNLKWEYVRLDKRELKLPQTKTGFKIVHVCPATIEVLEHLAQLRTTDNPYVIQGHTKGGHLVGLWKVWTSVLRAAKIEPIEGASGKLEQMRIHDIRHNFASSAISTTGASLKVVGALLGHKSFRSTERYAQLVREFTDEYQQTIGARLRERLNALLPPAITSL